MKQYKPRKWHGLQQHVPTLAHIGELVIGLVALAAVQGFWAVLVHANADITPPSVPTNLMSTGRAATEVDLSWSASTDDVGVTGYHVFRNGTQLPNNVTTPNFDDTGLTPNTNYTYTVSAYDATGNESAQSTSLAVSTLTDNIPPTIPSDVHQTGQTTSTVSLAWDASTDNVGVQTYDIYRNGTLLRSQPGTSYTDTGLAVYANYTYNIAARDASNNSSNLSSPLYATTAQDVTPPTVPTNLQKTGSTISSITLSWDAATDDVGVAGYKIYKNGSYLTSVGGNSYTATGLTVSSSYTFTVSAYDAAGNNSAQSMPYDTVTSDDTTPPTIPASVHTTSVLDTAISLAWDASSDDVGVMGYEVFRDGTLLGTTTSTSYSDSSLTPVTQYSYTIKAYDAANNVSAASSTLHATTAYDTTAPSVPMSLQATKITDTTVSLNWNASTDNVGVTGYDVYRGGSLITTTTGTNFTDSGLGVSTSYTYTVRAHDGSGNNSAQSNPLTVSTIADTVAPTTPSNLVSSSQTTTTISLSWNASTDDASSQSQISYNIYRDSVFIANQIGQTFTDSLLHYNKSYAYTVSAVDAAGNESMQTQALSVSTLADTTAPTVQLTQPGNGQSVQLTLPISANASDDLDLNRVEFYVDNTLIYTANTSPFTFNWNSYAVHNGQHTLSVKAVDASGNYASQSVSVTVTNPPPALLGDLNGDHKVNIYDLSILLAHFNKGGTGDFNNNGKVDIFDLSTLLSRFGQDDSNYN